MAAAPPRTPERDALFLEAIALGAPPGPASRAAGYTEPDVQRWRRQDRAFAEAWTEAIRTSLEEEADRRLRARYERPVVRRGVEIGTRNVCPDSLLFERYDALWHERHRRAARPPGRTRRPRRRARQRGFARAVAWLRALFARTPGAKAHGR
jgi:hypothetical protein